MMKVLKKTLALLLALVMCVGMLSVAAFAAEDEDHEHNKGGWACSKKEKLTCETKEHSHDNDDCKGDSELICTMEEHKHNQSCYPNGTNPACGKELHAHTEACYKVECELTVHTHNSACYETVWDCYKQPCIWRDKIKTVDPTCTEPGKKVKLCEECGAEIETTVDESSPALGHTVVTDPRVEPTTTSTGLTEGSHCSVCDEVIVAQQEIPMLPTNPATGTGGTEIEDPDVPLGGDPDDGGADDGAVLIDEPEVPLAGLMTRAEFVNYLYVQAGSPDAQASTFADVAEDHEYAAAIGWAQANGIAKGITENEFAPDEIVSVDQAHLFLVRYAQFMGVDMPELAALAGKDPLEILDNADEVLAEFFAAISPKEQAA